MSSPSSSRSPSEESGLPHSLSFFGSGEVSQSRELSEDNCLVFLLLSSSLIEKFFHYNIQMRNIRRTVFQHVFTPPLLPSLSGSNVNVVHIWFKYKDYMVYGRLKLCHVLPVFSVTLESGNRQKVDMQRLSPRFRSQQFFLRKI